MTRDLRKFARQTNIRSLAGFVLILFIIGDGLIYIFYGKQAALLGVICLFFGLAPLLLIWLALWGVDIIVKKANRD
jgi:hypothetical protein